VDWLGRTDGADNRKDRRTTSKVARENCGFMPRILADGRHELLLPLCQADRV